MMKIICNEENHKKLRACFKKGLCPVKDTSEYCYEECVYNKGNISYEESDNDNIVLVGISDDFVCYKDTIFHYPECGEVKRCDSCKFLYSNIEFKMGDEE